MVWLESGRWQRGDGGQHLCGLLRLGRGDRVAAAAPAHVPSKEPRKLKPGAVCVARRTLLKMLPLILGNLLMRGCALVIIGAVFVAPAVHAKSGMFDVVQRGC